MTVSKDQNAPPSYDDAVNGGRGASSRLSKQGFAVMDVCLYSNTPLVPTGLMSNGPYNVVSTLPPAVPPRVNSFEG